MRVDFIGHATLLIRSGQTGQSDQIGQIGQIGSTALITDPWWEGPAYSEQWYPYPFPVPERYDLGAVDAVYLSHGHEDHQHEATLRTLRRDLMVVTPRSFESATPSWLRELGFREVKEVPSGQSCSIERGGGAMRLTVLTHLGDSILCVEADGRVLINVNDALHAARADVIDAYCALLRERFPRVDYLFCGFGGASWFPNCFRVPGKDDVGVAARRERFFLENFARIANRLEPRHAFPFAAHFILPSERNFWISAERLTAPPPSVALRGLCRVPCHDLRPGDWVEGDEVHTARPPRIEDPEAVRRRALERWPPTRRPRVGAERLEMLIQLLSANASRFGGRLPRRAELCAGIRLSDLPGHAILVRRGGGHAEVRPIATPALDGMAPPLVLETRSDLLLEAAGSLWGRDLLTIGYGGIVEARSAGVVQRGLHEQLLDLLTPLPNWRERLASEPARCAAYLARDPGVRIALRRELRRMAGLRAHEQSPVYSIEEWISPLRATG
jgi:hypothetical protein